MNKALLKIFLPADIFLHHIFRGQSTFSEIFDLVSLSTRVKNDSSQSVILCISIIDQSKRLKDNRILHQSG